MSHTVLFHRLSFGTAQFTALLGTPLEWFYGFLFWLGLFAAYTLVFFGLRVSSIYPSDELLLSWRCVPALPALPSWFTGMDIPASSFTAAGRPSLCPPLCGLPCGSARSHSVCELPVQPVLLPGSYLDNRSGDGVDLIVTCQSCFTRTRPVLTLSCLPVTLSNCTRAFTSFSLTCPSLQCL